MRTVLAAFLLLMFAACASEPEPPSPSPPPAPPAEMPTAVFEFERIEAADIDTLKIYANIAVENPRNSAAFFSVKAGTVFIGDVEPDRGWTAEAGEIKVEAKGSGKIPIAYTLNLKEIEGKSEVEDDGAYVDSMPNEIDEGGEADIIEAKAVHDIAAKYDNGETAAVRAAGAFSFPRLREPKFSIVSIAVRQAELINTRLLVRLNIENPNPFSVELSNFKYELYGHGRFWADGEAKKVFTVPAKSSEEKNLFLLMNFTNMRREILDRIIAMHRVRYEFKGTAEIAPDAEFLPAFTSSFHLKGESEVVE